MTADPDARIKSYLPRIEAMLRDEIIVNTAEVAATLGPLQQYAAMRWLHNPDIAEFAAEYLRLNLANGLVAIGDPNFNPITACMLDPETPFHLMGGHLPIVPGDERAQFWATVTFLNAAIIHSVEINAKKAACMSKLLFRAADGEMLVNSHTRALIAAYSALAEHAQGNTEECRKVAGNFISMDKIGPRIYAWLGALAGTGNGNIPDSGLLGLPLFRAKAGPAPMHDVYRYKFGHSYMRL